MILFKKIVSLKNIFVNKSHAICKSLVEISQNFMGISLNHMDFTGFSTKKC